MAKQNRLRFDGNIKKFLRNISIKKCPVCSKKRTGIECKDCGFLFINPESWEEKCTRCSTTKKYCQCPPESQFVREIRESWDDKGKPFIILDDSEEIS